MLRLHVFGVTKLGRTRRTQESWITTWGVAVIWPRVIEEKEKIDDLEGSKALAKQLLSHCCTPAVTSTVSSMG